MTMKKTLARLLCAAAFAVAAVPALAQETIKVGVLSQDTGPFADAGRAFHEAIGAYVATHGKQAGGRTIEFIYRDIGGPSPANAKRLAEELVVREKVQILAGFYLTPDALSAAPVINQTQTPAVLFMAASPSVLKASPLFVRSGQNIGQAAVSSAVYARKLGKGSGYVVVADYAPGHDVQHAFTKAFEEKGGKVLGATRVPLSTVDFSAVAERVAQAKPDVVEMFITPGAPAMGMIRALAERGLMKSTLVIGIGEAEDHLLPQYDDSVEGFYQTLYYAEALDNAENKAYMAKLKELYSPTTLPSFTGAAAYDGAHEIYQMVENMAGKPWNGAQALKSIEGMTWNAVRGPTTIDAKTHELIQNMYIRRIDKVDGKLKNVVVDTIEQVVSPTLEWMTP
jgi:branched-chain amino acid transport system substrate-binding protein